MTNDARIGSMVGQSGDIYFWKD